jgi:hypothetical protein
MIEPMMFAGETRFFACTGVLIGHHKSTTKNSDIGEFG